MSPASLLGLASRRPMSLLVIMATVCGTAALAGCTVNNATAGVDAGPGTPDGGGADAPPGDGTASGPLAFTPSNVDLSGIDLTKVGDFVVDAVGCSVNTDGNLASCGDGAGVLGFKLATQSDGSKVGVYVARSMTILAGKSLTVEGSHPLVFIALDTITIAGSLNGNSRSEVGIAGGQSRQGQTPQRAKGAGPGGGGAGTDLTASGGGSYCGIGGAGGAESGPAASGGAAYGNAEITPLAAGSAGGDIGGAGGGAIQLVAGNAIAIAATGVVQAGGGGGGFGGIRTQNAAGGGSGGSILLESLAVTVDGTLAANGGGAGAGTSNGVGAPPPEDPGGADSTANATPAAGGKKGVGPSSGGDGSAGTAVNGTAGSFTAVDNNAAGGGGGGAGRIRINTKSGKATLSGVISPATSTSCATQGAVR